MGPKIRGYCYFLCVYNICELVIIMTCCHLSPRQLSTDSQEGHNEHPGRSCGDTDQEKLLGLNCRQIRLFLTLEIVAKNGRTLDQTIARVLLYLLISPSYQSIHILYKNIHLLVLLFKLDMGQV